MLVLLFNLGNEFYALDCSRVVEIIPRVDLRPVYQAPIYVAGLFNYRGKLVPVVDLCHLIQGNSCRSCLSTRIIIVNYSFSGDRVQYLGLMAEKVTDTLYQPETDFEKNNSQTKTTTHLGSMIIDEQKMIQLISIDTLVGERELSGLLIGGEVEKPVTSY